MHFFIAHIPLNAAQTTTRCSSISSSSPTDAFAGLTDLEPITQAVSIEEAHGIEPQSYNDYFTSLSSHSINASDTLPTLQLTDLTTFSPEPEEETATQQNLTPRKRTRSPSPQPELPATTSNEEDKINKRVKVSPTQERVHTTPLQIPTTPTSILSIPSPSSSIATTPRSYPLTPLQLSPLVLSPQSFRLPVAETQSQLSTPLSSPYGTLPHFFSSSINTSNSSSSVSSSSTTSTTSVVANPTPQTSTTSTALVPSTLTTKALPKDPREQLLILISATILPCPTIYPATIYPAISDFRWVCATCNKTFAGPKLLELHAQVHITNPFYCRLCGFALQSSKDLVDHCRTVIHRDNYLLYQQRSSTRPVTLTGNS